MTNEKGKGIRVKTKFGLGTIEGREYFSNDEYRVAVKLDEPHTWACKGKLCYFFAGEFEKVMPCQEEAS